jgi:hypothetical protein
VLEQAVKLRLVTHCADEQSVPAGVCEGDILECEHGVIAELSLDFQPVSAARHGWDSDTPGWGFSLFVTDHLGET